MPSEHKPIVRYILAEGDWYYLADDRGDWFIYETLEEAQKDLPEVADQVEFHPNDIVILKETREAMN